ncbi:MAG: hypothetical protein AAF449_00570 [Myxococcota bacterium]
MQKSSALSPKAMGLHLRSPLADHARRRLESAEDRYMALYGKEEWAASNMNVTIHVDPAQKSALVDSFMRRLDRELEAQSEATRLFQEEADFSQEQLSFRLNTHIRAQDLLQPRRGVYIDLEQPDGVRVVWNHMQTDGVGMWNMLRPLFDENPPLIPYKHVPPPPIAIPELLALPSVARRMTWRSRLRKGLASSELTRGVVRWDAAHVRGLRDQVRGSFNLVTSALTLMEVFRRHQDRTSLNVGLTAYFPFLTGRNKYGVLLCRVKRGDLASIVTQLTKQTRHQILNWGRSAAQSFALRQLPDGAFTKVVGYYRRQVDVLISNLPVGTRPIMLDGIPAMISCHPWELTLPYYFLLVGTKQELHVSFTSRYRQDAQFLRCVPAPVYGQSAPPEAAAPLAATA